MKRTLALILLAVFSLFTALLIFSGCNTYKKQLAKATAFFDANPKALAPLCEQKFPVVDSVGKPIYLPATNVNYTGKLDSLKGIADQFKQQLQQQAVDKSNPCASVASADQQKFAALYDEISTLQSEYKTCKPDTVKIPIYQKDMAEINVLQNNFDVKTDSLKITKHDLQLKTEESTSRLHWIFGLGGILLLLIAISILKLLGKLSFL